MKVEHANGFERTLGEIDKAKDNHRSILKDIAIKKGLFEETKVVEEERLVEIEEEVRVVEGKVEVKSNVFIDEDTKMRVSTFVFNPCIVNNL